MARSVTNAELLQALKALTAKVEALAEQGAMRDRIAALEAQVADLRDRPGGGMGPLMAGNPFYRDAAPETDDTQVVDADDVVRALGAQITGSQDPDSDFFMDDVEVEIGGGLGKTGDKVQLGLNAREALRGNATSRVKYTLRRKSRPKVID
ncbi:MAG: Vitamin-D-receptor interacting Mediator subunit 17t [Rhodobacteraceae bacterium HLUCCA08]|nr:MAG: Vitamin-D-receptor interacting Mediator subunit 17t [Rhodobacteraceae bacterium HLUCCA08]